MEFSGAPATLLIAAHTHTHRVLSRSKPTEPGEKPSYINSKKIWNNNKVNDGDASRRKSRHILAHGNVYDLAANIHKTGHISYLSRYLPTASAEVTTKTNTQTART